MVATASRSPRAQVSAVRRVSVDAVMRALLARGLITGLVPTPICRRGDVRHHRMLLGARITTSLSGFARYRTAASRRRR